MANRQHLKILKQGISTWNQWRKDHPEIQPDLSKAHLEGIDLRKIHLEATNLSNAYLGKKENSPTSKQPANLQGAFFDKLTNLEGVILGNNETGFISIADVDWNGVNLAVVDWKHVKMLGEECEARRLIGKDGKEKRNVVLINEYQIAIRANRQLAVTLQSQGLNEHASYFAYRAQLNQRNLLKLQVTQYLEQVPKLRFLIQKPNTLLMFIKTFIDLYLIASIFLIIFYTLTLLTDARTILGLIPVNRNVIYFLLFFHVLILITFLIIYALLFLILFRLALLACILFIIYLSPIILTFLLSIFITRYPVLLNFFLLIIFMFLFMTFTMPLRRKIRVTFQTKEEADILSRISKLKHSQSIHSRFLLVFTVQANYGRYVFSLFLDLLAGYGYKPMRSVIIYLVIIVMFASFYYTFGYGLQPPLTALGALVLSLTSFHGRGFFPGLGTNGNPPIDSPVIVLAAIEAVIGLIIEISFIATFTQRYFGK